MKINKRLIGKLVAVKFLDHSIYSKELCLCRVAGWVVDVTKDNMVVAWWDLIHEDLETIESNQEHCSIIISAIKEIKVY